MTKKIVAIHQPNFFPWLGYFDKIARADIFVFLDDVAYPKSGSGSGSWCNRVKVNVQGNSTWVGCPIRRQSGEQLIKDVLIDDAQPWRKKLLKTLELNYKKAPYFVPIMEVLESIIVYPSKSLADFNKNTIQTICKLMKISGNFISQSELQTAAKSTHLLIEIINAVNGSAYLCGGGASGYQQDILFTENNIELIYQNFTPQPYGIPDKFIPGLSIIDYLMHHPLN